MQITIFNKDDLKNKLKTRVLYEENFDIGKKEFIDYYYDRIIKRNEVIALVEDNNIISMIHLNPYKYNVFGTIYNIHYLVALATKKEYRGNGYMSMLLNKAIKYLKDLNEPFCYLVPENVGLERFYNKFSFEAICQFTIDKFSKDKYDIYPVNDEEYKELMINEDRFLQLETNEYKAELSKKRVMIRILNSSEIYNLESFKNCDIYICQEV